MVSGQGFGLFVSHWVVGEFELRACEVRLDLVGAAGGDWLGQSCVVMVVGDEGPGLGDDVAVVPHVLVGCGLGGPFAEVASDLTGEAHAEGLVCRGRACRPG